jgi:hypothetical protein
MKSLFKATLILSVAFFASCGSSQEDEAAKEKARQDSIVSSEQLKAEEEAAKAQAMQDSIQNAERIEAEKTAADSTAKQ